MKVEENGIHKKERLSTKIRKEAFLQALKKSMGIITPALKTVGNLSPETVRQWREKDPDFARRMDECEMEQGDFVESKLLQCINEGDTSAIIFYCKTKLKKRGYTERNEVTGTDGKDLFPANEMTREEIMAEIERIRSIRNDK